MTDLELQTEVLFELITKINDHIRLTRNYWNYIVEVKHPELANKLEDIRNTLINPDIIERSKTDPDVKIYYRKQNGHYWCVVTKVIQNSGFVITAHIARKLRKGDIIWTKQAS